MVAFPIVELVVAIITTALVAGGVAAMFALMAVESFGIPPIPSEIILVFGGFLVATGGMTWYGAFLSALAGGVAGSYAAYAVGRYGRKWITETGPRWLRLDPKHLAVMDRWFERYGEGTIAFARLVPIIRAYISYPAGTARMSPTRFGVYTALGAAPFTAALLYAGYVLGANWGAVVPWFHLIDYAAAGAIFLTVIYLLLRWRNVLAPGFPPRLVRKARPDTMETAPPP